MRKGCIGLGLVLVGLAQNAHAGEEEWQVTLTPAYAVVDFDTRTPSGAGLAVDVGYGITESLTVRAAVAWSAHPVDENKMRKLGGGTLQVTGAFGGIRYAFDLLRTVPYLNLGLGAIYASGPDPDSTNFSYEAAIGFDRLMSRRWAWGAIAAYHGFVSNYSKLPVYLYVGPNISFRWE